MPTPHATTPAHAPTPAQATDAGSAIRVERRGAVGYLTLDRRQRYNSLDVATARDLRKAGLQLARDSAVRAVVVTGAGGVFCSGADLKEIRATAPPGGGYGAGFQAILEYLHATIAEIRRAPKPFIAAVDGPVAAGGLGLALCCDLVVASERSSFEFAYFKTALTGAEGTSLLLPRLLGARRALDFAFLGPRLTGREAVAWGLASAVFADADFAREVDALADRLAAGPTGAYAEAKRLFNESTGLDRLDHHLSRELEALIRAADGPEFAEGIAAFFGKRGPAFGRGNGV